MLNNEHFYGIPLRYFTDLGNENAAYETKFLVFSHDHLQFP